MTLFTTYDPLFSFLFQVTATSSSVVFLLLLYNLRPTESVLIPDDSGLFINRISVAALRL